MQIVRWIIGSAVFLALLFLSLQNADPVTLKFFQLASWQAPLVFVVFIAFAAGVAAGLLAGALRASRLKRDLNRLRRAQRASAGADTTTQVTVTPAGADFVRNDRTPGAGPAGER